MNLRIGITFSLLGRVYSANDRRQTLVLEFDYDRALHERRRRDTCGVLSIFF